MGTQQKFSIKLCLAILALGCSLVWSDQGSSDIEDTVIGPFGLLNNRDNAMAISANQAQDLLNVDVSQGGKTVKKRAGFAGAFALSVTTNPVHGTYIFYDSNGNDIALYFNDTVVSASTSGASPGVLYSTGPSGATYQCTDSQGFAYCLNTSRTSFLKTNGVSNSFLGVASTGTMVTVTPDRLVTAGFSGTPNRIDFSKSGDFTTWTVGSLATDPTNFTISAPGSKITHITYAFNRVMWFKENSFGYILPGSQPSQADWIVKTISPNIGTLDNTSVYWGGTLYFKANDGHFYSYDGSNLEKLSRDIPSTVSQTQTRRGGSWLQTTAADWNSGIFDDSRFVDTDTVSGTMSVLWPDTFDTFRNGDNSTRNVYTFAWDSNGTSTSVAINNGQLQAKVTSIGSTGPKFYVRTSSILNNYTPGTTYYLDISSMSTESGSNRQFYFVLSSSLIASPANLISTNNYLYTQFVSTKSNTILLRTAEANSVNLYSGPTSGGFALPITFALYIDTTNYQFTINGSSVIKRGTHTWPSGGRYAYFYYQFGNLLSDVPSIDSFTIDNFAVIPTTFTFSSAVNNASSLTSWDTFTGNTVTSGGPHAFSMRSSNSSFAASAGSPAWASVTLGAIPTISTGSYFQVRDFFSTTSSNTMSLADFTVNWFEGNAADKAYATYYNDGIWWAVPIGTSATTNNRVLIYDLLNQGWKLYDIASNGFYIRNTSLYFGSSSTGNIYKFGDVNNDNGSAINAYWKSKDFFGSSPFLDKEIGYISVSGVNNSGTTLNVSYITNASTTTNTYSFSMSGSNGFFKHNKNIIAGKIGSTYNIQFGNNASNQPFEIDSVGVGLRTRPWNASQ